MEPASGQSQLSLPQAMVTHVGMIADPGQDECSPSPGAAQGRGRRRRVGSRAWAHAKEPQSREMVKERTLGTWGPWVQLCPEPALGCPSQATLRLV